MAETALGERLERRIRERAARAGARAAVRMETELKSRFQVHRKSGDTQASVRVTLGSVTATSIEYLAVATTPQAKFVNDGTPRHFIYARPGGALRFQWPAGPPELRHKDGFYYFAHVDHPGYIGDPWWDETVARWSEFVDDALAALGGSG